ncbi:MAG: hypothetical protein IMW99_11585 [Firmicutes bacterium]|nr:hypothetical protein [Bacillota bacterium]
MRGRALCGLARLYYRHGQAVGITAVLLAGGIPALPFLAVAVYLAWVVQRRRVATP